MSYSNNNYVMISSYLLLLLSLLVVIISTTAAYDANYLGVICLSSDIDVNNSTIYLQSREILLNELSSIAQRPDFDGFTQYTCPSDVGLIIGLSLCRGDISMEECRACLASATSDIATSDDICSLPSKIVFRKQCSIKYSNRLDFYGKLDTSNAYFSCNGSNDLSLPGDGFADRQIGRAVVSEKMFDNSNTNGVDVVVQCSRDLSVTNCTTCLKLVAAQLASVCQHSNSGAYYTGSCWVTYDLIRP